MKRGLSVIRTGILGTNLLKITLALAIGGPIAGCAGPGGGGGIMVASIGGNCASLRKELGRLDARGVPSIIEAKNAGRRVSAKKQRLINRYNAVLDSYLANKCHVKR